ncbi:hypothetical protein MXMO3_01752 [Maritalea myrionectae]|uniref:Uncharacterized protein n=1 Tax=Maritalea myrionectae TaxID=454601 RepID=A0A2R4ME20_9HYPH|nr:hypothetical protein [Maritalea myrionectae]AVX04277.1 hypothetical protein MXMO3_01752 [Maritalea myrionectae]
MAIARRNPRPWQNLKPGDEFTFIRDEPIIDKGEPVNIGDIFPRQFDDDGPRYAFRVFDISGATYQCIYLGQILEAL